MRAWLICWCAMGCALFGLTAIAAESRRTIDASRVLDAAAPRVSGALTDMTISRTPPDPPPMSARKQWVLDLRWDRGDVWLLRVRSVDLPEPRVTPRALGRFALELFEGPAVLERVRFDFPLLSVPDSDGAPSLTGRLRTRIGVFFPVTPRGTRLELVDRASNRRWSIPWPPTSSTPSTPSTPAENASGDSGALPAPTDGGAGGPSAPR